MKILIRDSKNKDWQIVRSAAYGAESELQRLLAETPSLIPIDETEEKARTLVTAIREFPLDIGSIDILGFSAKGDIAIIECKLASNDEIKRKVISQVFEYGANLWLFSYDDLDKKVFQKTSESLSELVRRSVDQPDWNEEIFKQNVSKSLKDGNFVLMIVVDEINEEMSRIIKFINYAGNPAFSLSALEMKRFKQGETEMLVPHVYGIPERGKQDTGTSNRKKWDETSYFEEASKELEPKVYELVKNIYGWTKETADITRFGSGWASGSFTYCIERNGKIGSVFSLYTNGVLYMNYGYMRKIYTASQIKEFADKITSIPTMREASASDKLFFSIAIDKALPTDDIIKKFKNIVTSLKKLPIQDSEE